MAGQRVWAKRPFQYGGLDLGRGQVFELRGSPNDDKLLGMGYVAAVEKGTQLTKCGECGAEFLGHGELRHHGDAKHPARPRSEEEEDRFLDRQEAMLETLAPIGA